MNDKKKKPFKGISQQGSFNQSGISNSMIIGRVGGTVTQNVHGPSGLISQTIRTSSHISFSEVQTLDINGKVYSGRKIEQKDGRIFVDDKDVTDEVGVLVREINVVVQGPVANVDASGINQLTVNGNAGKVNTVSGDVKINGEVGGSVETISGEVKCGKVSGSVKTVSGDVRIK